MAHYRSQITTAVHGLLVAGVSWGTVYRWRTRPKPDPASETASRSVNMATVRDELQGVSLDYGSSLRSLEITVEVTTRGPDDGTGAIDVSLDVGCTEVEKALVKQTLGGLLSGGLLLTSTEIEVETDADATRAQAVLTFGGEYNVEPTDPETGA